MVIGDHVRVKKDEPEGLSGRSGVIVRENQFGKGPYGNGEGLWYIQLEATKRAKARTACCWGKYLEVIS